jgi:hypothetical protein
MSIKGSTKPRTKIKITRIIPTLLVNHSLKMRRV